MTQPTEVVRSHRSWVVFGVTALGAFVASLDLSIVNVAFPAIGRSFPHDSRAGLAWILTSYTIVFGALLVTGGKTADRHGRRATFFAGLGVFAVGSALCGVAPSLELLVAGRVLQGVGSAFALPASLGLLLAAYPPARRAQMVAMWGGIGALAVATGPSLGALLVTYAGWRLVFYVNVPVCALAVLVGRVVLTEARQPSPKRTDLLGVALLSVALAGLVLAISEGSTWGWGDARTVGAVAAFVVLLPCFVLRSAHHDDPVLDLGLLRSRTVSVSNLGTLVYAMAFFAMLLGNILFLTGVWHWSILRAGLAVTPAPVVVSIVARRAGRLAVRFGFRRVLVIGSAILTVGLLWYVVAVGHRPDYPSDWLPATLLSGLGIGLTFPVLSAAAVSGLPSERFAVGSALNQTARQVGGAIGIAMLVAILGANQSDALLRSFDHLWIYEASLTALTGVVALALGRSTVTASAGIPQASVAPNQEAPAIPNPGSAGSPAQAT